MKAMILIDFSKALVDLVDHGILLRKITNYGISLKALYIDWFRSYLIG
jgi:hypothetical protein